MKNPTWSMRWRRYHIYWLITEFRFLDSMLFRDFLFELNLSPTASILDKFIFQEYGMTTHNHIMILKKIEVVSYDFLRIPYKMSLKGPNL